jgi:predicted glycosyltransferase
MELDSYAGDPVMRILLEAHHPAHIHFWKYPVRELQARGHEVLMIGRDRDVMRRLLEVYDWIPAEIPKRRTKNNRFPLLEMLERQWAVARAIHRFKPDVVASLMGSYTQSAKLFGVRNVIFTDTETQALNHRIAHPFADEIHTPDCFLLDFGEKHRRYAGLHENAYLAANYFEKDEAALAKYGLGDAPYLILRVSAWNTFHDRDRKGIGEAVYPFIEEVKDRYRIVLSAEEGKVPPGLEGYALTFAPEDFHSLIAGARFLVTEGASTASEAACLGVPSVFINSVGDLGNFRLLSERFGLIRAHRTAETGMPEALELAKCCETRVPEIFSEKYRVFVESRIDVCAYVVETLL